MKKAPDAFRTISEVSDLLGTPAHVLRFWESKFYQIKPVKRAGGRRYYRPDDVALINGIRVLLHEQELTIRGAQRVLQEQGVKHVQALGMPLPEDPVLEAEDESDDEVAPVTVENTSVPEGEVSDPVPPAPAPERTGVTARMPVPPRAEIDAKTPESEVESPAIAAAASPPETVEVPSPAVQVVQAEAAPQVESVDEEAQSAAEPEPLRAEQRLAHRLRAMGRGQLGKKRDAVDVLARRIDALLERMSEASGAGRW